LRLLLVGSTGFLGKNVARRLARAGHALRLLARAGSNLEGLPTDAEIVRGDVTDLDRCSAVSRAATRSCTWRRWSRCGRPTARSSTA
jgi:nucleoside-diphosphate-sugar epimerase